MRRFLRFTLLVAAVLFGVALNSVTPAAAEDKASGVEIRLKSDWETKSSTAEGKGATNGFGRWGFTLIPHQGPFSSFEFKGFRTESNKSGLSPVDGGYLAANYGAAKITPIRISSDKKAEDRFNTGVQFNLKDKYGFSLLTVRPLWLNFNSDGARTGNSVRAQGTYRLVKGIDIPFGYDYEFRTHASKLSETHSTFGGVVTDLGRYGVGVSYGRDYGRVNRVYFGANDKVSKYGLLSQFTWNPSTHEQKGEFIFAQNAGKSTGPDGVISHQERYTIGEENEDKRRSSPTAGKADKPGYVGKVTVQKNAKGEDIFTPEIGRSFGGYGFSVGKNFTEVGDNNMFVAPFIKLGDMYIEGALPFAGGSSNYATMIYVSWSPVLWK